MDPDNHKGSSSKKKNKHHKRSADANPNVETEGKQSDMENSNSSPEIISSARLEQNEESELDTTQMEIGSEKVVESAKLLRLPGVTPQLIRFLNYPMFKKYEEMPYERVVEALENHKKFVKESEGVNPFSADRHEGYFLWFHKLLIIQDGLRRILSPVATFAMLGYFCMIFPMTHLNEFIEYCKNDGQLDRDEAKLIEEYLSKTILPFYLANREWCMKPKFFTNVLKDGEITYVILVEFLVNARKTLKEKYTSIENLKKSKIDHFATAVGFLDNSDDANEGAFADQQLLQATTSLPRPLRIENDSPPVIAEKAEEKADREFREALKRSKREFDIRMGRNLPDQSNSKSSNRSNETPAIKSKLFTTPLPARTLFEKAKDEEIFPISDEELDLDIDDLIRGSSEEGENELLEKPMLYDPPGFHDLKKTYPDISHRDFFELRRDSTTDNSLNLIPNMPLTPAEIMQRRNKVVKKAESKIVKAIVRRLTRRNLFEQQVNLITPNSTYAAARKQLDRQRETWVVQKMLADKFRKMLIGKYRSSLCHFSRYWR